MKTYRIAVIPGDGIGKELAPEGMRVLDAAARAAGGFSLEYEIFPWGCDYYVQHGMMMPEDGLKTLSTFAAIYFGAVGYPELVPDDVSLHGLLIKLRLGFDQYVCLRPSTLLPGVKSPLRGVKPGDIDFVTVRENTEGEYAGAGGRMHPGQPSELAIETAVFTRAGCERVIRYAFELARSRPRRMLAHATKSNAQKHTLTFWDQIFDEVARDYPDVKTERVLVDAMAARFVLKPGSLDVVVASNLFGDILTDIGGAITGSLGLSASGNIDPERRYPSMFEPVHGSAPDIAGKGIANPIAMAWSGAMMLDFLGEKRAGALIEAAIRAVTAEGTTLTPDLGGTATTTQVTDALVAKVNGLAKA
ncbi:putative tartrate dehydrogenase/decarboxylase TtuC' [Fundidesulfovibrio magnetotacticus]|uniref:D-malate dehydrogenase (decarboxylating) n=1 Tax=Fundidesulfovibrio magnetotacticus TaxID=2730080 RepID=A0A6V8LL57_9BACT|nr:tartrate dehydrogenase [Fundidesulfovibrio magnetotacticus]GFK93422.1 putative tartrate dehydrogenase/decarboxylase TtuC' [Fundidesulfovibrio magnetotacticus]